MDVDTKESSISVPELNNNSNVINLISSDPEEIRMNTDDDNDDSSVTTYSSVGKFDYISRKELQV